MLYQDLPGSRQSAEHPCTPCLAPSLQPCSVRARFPQALSPARESSSNLTGACSLSCSTRLLKGLYSSACPHKHKSSFYIAFPLTLNIKECTFYWSFIFAWASNNPYRTLLLWPLLDLEAYKLFVLSCIHWYFYVLTYLYLYSISEYA